MKRIIFPAILALFVATAVQAQLPTGYAIGYDQMVQGISLRLLPAGGIGVEGMVGFTTVTPKASGAGTGYNLNLGANLLKTMFTPGSRVRVNGLAGLQVFMNKPAISDADTHTEIDILVGLEPEVFVWDSLSLSTRMGLQIRFVGDQLSGAGQKITDSGSTVFGTFGPQFSLLNGLNIRYYF